jgi:hypothetical protein
MCNVRTGQRINLRGNVHGKQTGNLTVTEMGCKKEPEIGKQRNKKL